MTEHMRQLSQLIGGLAHELKNPLSTINLNLSLLDEDMGRCNDDLHRRWRRRLQGVEEEVSRIRGILDDFLRFAGNVELNPQPTDLARLVDEMVGFFTPQTEANRVVLRTALPAKPVRADVDGNLLKQAVLNLLLNAVEAMPGGGELLIKLATVGSSAVIEVIDTGPGMDAETLGRIFDVYYSTKTNGTGLGLPTTRRIAQEHNGELEVDSEVGKGTRFTLVLPLSRETERDGDAP